MKLEFDTAKGYIDREIKDEMTIDDYLSMPVIAWCHRKIGPMDWPRDPNQVLHGDGWEILADWSEYLAKTSLLPQTYVIITKPVDDQLLTDFWMRFQ